MKNLVFVLATFLTLGFLSSCNKEANDVSNTETLIEEIATSSAKQDVSPAELPANALTFIEDEHFETYIENVAYVSGSGYEVELATEDVEYFDRNGNVLRSSVRPHQCHRPGPCGGGQRIRIDSLPGSVTDYITANYPDETIRRAKIKGNKILVAITGPTILVFELDGTFVLEAPLIRFCFGERLNHNNLPAVITDYIADNYPDAEIKVAFRVRGKIVVGVMTDEGRKLLVFNLAGEFLFERP